MNENSAMSLEPLLRSDLISYISDAHKDAYGFRPHGRYDFDSMSMADLEALASELSDAVVESIEEDRKHEARCREKFEKSVALALEAGAENREAAVRWLLDAEGLLFETVGYTQYSLGVGYDYNVWLGTVDHSFNGLN